LAAVGTGGFVYIADIFRPVQNDSMQIMDIRDFVKQPFIHGVPYDDVMKYDAAATVPILIGLLKDPSYKAARAQIATTLGMLGSPDAVEPLIELAESGEGELSPTEYDAKTGALGALGLILNRQINARAFDYLKAMAIGSPLTINKLKWASPSEDSIEKRNVEIARTAIIALGFSGRKETEVFLKSLQKVSIVPTTLPLELKKSVDVTIKNALITNAAIQNGKESGLKNYYNKTLQ
jgi:hypothetical protein